MAIVDDLGHPLSHDEALLVLLTLVTEAHPGARMALPVAASGAAEEICREAGAEIVWTKLSASHLMEVARSEQVTLAASQSGGFIFPAFLPAFDAAATLVNLLALLTATGRKLSELVAGHAPGAHRPPGGAHARGTRRAWSCAPWWSAPRAASWSWSTG